MFLLCAAELYTPATGTWSEDKVSPSGAANFGSRLLNIGTVLFSGGTYGSFPGKTDVLADATLFDPTTDASTTTSSMSIPRAAHTLTQLPNGQVLAAGGETQNNVGKFSITASAELFTP